MTGPSPLLAATTPVAPSFANAVWTAFWNFFAHHEWKWLVLQGILPLFGAALLFLVVGAFRSISRSHGKPAAAFHWTAGFDPFGWLYGVAVISINSAVIAWNAPPHPYYYAQLGPCLLVAALCIGLLYTAMYERGLDTSWAPQPIFKIIVFILICATLVLGWLVHQ